MRKFTLLFFLSLLPFLSISQYIEGQVFDASNNKPIEGVHVYVDGVENGTYTNSKGTYYLKIPNTVNNQGYIHFSHIGYQKSEVRFNKKQKKYNIYLVKEVRELDEVTLREERHLNKMLRFKKLKSMNLGLHSFGSVLVDGKIYVIGGNASFTIDGLKKTLLRLENTEFSQLSFAQFLQRVTPTYDTDIFKGDFIVYDIALDSWERNKSLFEKRANHNVHLYEDELYVLGGTKLSKGGKTELLVNDIEIGDLKNRSIQIDETNPHQAVYFASFVYQDKLIVLGGSTKLKKNDIKEYTDQVHLYDFKTGLWYELDNMPTAKETNGVLIGDKIYLIGGFKDKPLSEVESFDLKTKKWEIEGNLFYGINNAAISALDNTIYIYQNGKLFIYNVLTKNLDEYYINISTQNATMHIANNTLYLVGGVKVSDYSVSPSAALYSIDINELKKTRIIRSKKLGYHIANQF